MLIPIQEHLEWRKYSLGIGSTAQLTRSQRKESSTNVTLRVHQSIILSPVLYLIVEHGGIQWTLFSQLEDLDFADDLAILSQSMHDKQATSSTLPKLK